METNFTKKLHCLTRHYRVRNVSIGKKVGVAHCGKDGRILSY